LTFGTHPSWELIPLVRDLGELPPLSSRVIPVTVRRKNPPEPGPAPCEIDAHLDWFFPCGADNRYYRVPIVVFNASSACRYTPPAPPPFRPPIGGGPVIAGPGRPDYFFTPPGVPVAVCEEGCSPLLPHLNLPDFVQVLDVCDPSSGGEGVCARVSLS